MISKVCSPAQTLQRFLSIWCFHLLGFKITHRTCGYSAQSPAPAISSLGLAYVGRKFYVRFRCLDMQLGFFSQSTSGAHFQTWLTFCATQISSAVSQHFDSSTREAIVPNGRFLNHAKLANLSGNRILTTDVCKSPTGGTNFHFLAICLQISHPKLSHHVLPFRNFLSFALDRCSILCWFTASTPPALHFVLHHSVGQHVGTGVIQTNAMSTYVVFEDFRVVVLMCQLLPAYS